MKYGRVERFTVEHKTIRLQMRQFDFSGKTIVRIFGDDLPVLDFYDGDDPTVCYLEYFGCVFVEFSDGDILEIQGWDGEQYDEVFFVSVNDRSAKYVKEGCDRVESIVFGPFCYGKTTKGLKLLSDEKNSKGCEPHYIGLELEDASVLWFRQTWDETHVYLTDGNNKLRKGQFLRSELLSMEADLEQTVHRKRSPNWWLTEKEKSYLSKQSRKDLGYCETYWLSGQIICSETENKKG